MSAHEVAISSPARVAREATPAEDRRQRTVRLVVWATWLVMTGGALGFVHRFAPRVPTWDSWALLIPTLAGMHDPTPQLLWAQSNEHRLPLVNAILLPLGWLTGGALWIESYLIVLVLAGLAAALLRLGRRLRGAYRVTDVFLPLVVLNVGPHEIFLLRMTLGHVLPAVLAGLVLAVLASDRGALTLRRAWLLGGLLLALPLCGANGLPLVVAGVAWLVYAAWDARRENPAGPIRGQLALLGPALAAALLVGLYFVGFVFPHDKHPAGPNLRAVLLTGAQVLGLGLTGWRPELWPWVGLVVPALASVTGVLLVHRWWTDASERARAAGLLLYLGAGLGVALAVGWGRAALSPVAGTAPRYAMLSLPVLFTAYVGSLLYAPRWSRGAMEATLLGLLCLSLPSLLVASYRHGVWLRHESRVFEQLVREGTPAAYVAPRFVGSFYPARLAPYVAELMDWAERAGLRPFADAPPNSGGTWREEAITPELAQAHQMTWNGKRGESQGPDPYLVFALSGARRVAAVRIRFVLDGADPTPGVFQVFWMQDGVTTFREERSHRFTLIPSTLERTLVVPIHDTVDRLRLDPDVRPVTFEIRAITLLLREPRG